MAQHIDTQEIESGHLRRAERSIVKDFNDKGLVFVRGSLKYEELDGAYKEDEHDVVFHREVKVPYDLFVYKSDRVSLEIHFNKKTKKVTKIYMVA